jgi:hypothetical protein
MLFIKARGIGDFLGVSHALESDLLSGSHA